MMPPMESKEIHIDCPCCRSRLAVDVRTSKVLRWNREGEVDPSGKPKVSEEDWHSATGRVESRLSSAEDVFDAGLAREKNRSRDLDELFRDANQKSLGEDEEEG